jgi:Mg2+/Co2+ transporter CorB
MTSNYFFPLLIMALIFLTAFFSSTETAISVASKARLHRFLKSGHKSAKVAIMLHEKMGLVISVVLACNTIVNTVIATVGASFLIGIFGDQSGPIISAMIMSPLIWFAGEVLPKMFAIHKPESILLKAAPILNVIFKLFSPVNHIINLLASFVLRISGMTDKGASDANLDELKGAIDLHQRPDAEDTQDERAMLKSILDLGSVSVNEIMVHRKNVTMINSADVMDDIISQVLSSPFTRIPIWKDSVDNIVGVVHAKVLFRAIRHAEGAMDKLDILKIAQKPWFIPESKPLLDQLKDFQQRREHFANVVDEYGSWLGIVTLEDILEEIVGEISDENDVAFKGVRPQKDNSYIVDGNVTIRDLNRQFEWGLPDENASTIAGLILYQFRLIPTVGQIFTLDGFRFEILRRQRNQIMLLRVIPPALEAI